MPVEGDRRKNSIEVTPEGIEISNIALIVIKKNENKYMKKITSKDEEVLSKVLEVIKNECEISGL